MISFPLSFFCQIFIMVSREVINTLVMFRMVKLLILEVIGNTPIITIISNSCNHRYTFCLYVLFLLYIQSSFVFSFLVYFYSFNILKYYLESESLLHVYMHTYINIYVLYIYIYLFLCLIWIYQAHTFVKKNKEFTI